MRRIGRRRFLKLAGITALTGAAWSLRSTPATVPAARADTPQIVAVPAPAPRPLVGLRSAAAFDTPLPLPGGHAFMGLMEGTARIELVATAAPRSPADDIPPAPPLCFETGSARRPRWNPTLILQRGTSLRVRLINRLGAPTLLRWHGLLADWHMAGHPVRMLPPDTRFDYRLQVRNRAGVYPYHAMPAGFSGGQVHQGMVGLCIVEDEEERTALAAMDIAPSRAWGTGAFRNSPPEPEAGATDIPLLLQDRRLDRNGVPVYAPSLEDRASGFVGAVLTVNGVIGPHLKVATRLYRLRLINMCNARILHAGMSRADGAPLPFLLMGTDGGMLERPLPVQRLFLGPGERADILVDLRTARIDEEFHLVNLPFDPMRRARAASAGSGAPGEGESARLLQLRVTRRVDYTLPLPTRLCDAAPPLPLPQEPPRRLAVSRGEIMGRPVWLLNGHPFAMHHGIQAELPDDVPALRVTGRKPEVWELDNDAASIPHPLHVLGYQLRVLERHGSPAHVTGLAMDAAGRTATDTGIKDTVLVWPGETVKVLVDFRTAPIGPQRAALYSRALECLDGGLVQEVTLP